MQLSTICIVIPYFGKWPFWLIFFLASCRENATVDWLIYTDCGVPENAPSNVKFIEITYTKYCELVSSRLGIDFNPTNPYKLCDIKPALGFIHRDELYDYDYWAFGDIDLIYGNLRKYFKEEKLAKKQVFSTHSTRISGHLCLLKNTTDLLSAFQKVADWKQKFSTKQHLAFDEKDFSKIFIRHKNSPQWLKSLAAWKDPWLKLAEFSEAYTTPNGRIPWVDGTYDFPTIWHWKSGELNANDVETTCTPYFHFLSWKNGWRNAANGKHIAQNFINKSQHDLIDFKVMKNGFCE